MKRKGILVVAVLPLVIGLFVAKRLADKRPNVVTHGVGFKSAKFLAISPNGERMFVWPYVAPSDPNHDSSAQIVSLCDGSRVDVPVDSLDSDWFGAFFSSDSQRIYQLSFHNDMIGDKGVDLVRISARDGRKKKEFLFAEVNEFYGFYARGNEVIAESPHRTWHLNANHLQILTLQTRNRSPDLDYGLLCPDGKTVMKPNYYPDEFRDLETGKLLWRLPEEIPQNPKFSPDGRTLLTQKNGEVIARDTRTGIEKWRLRGPQSSVLALAPDESAIYEARENGELWKWPR